MNDQLNLQKKFFELELFVEHFVEHVSKASQFLELDSRPGSETRTVWPSTRNLEKQIWLRTLLEAACYKIFLVA